MKNLRRISGWCWLKLLGYAAILYSFLGVNVVLAKGGIVVAPPVKLSEVTTAVGSTVISVGAIISDIALVAGIGFLLTSFFKFDQHKKNPTQIPVSQPLTLLLLGAALCLMPTMLPLVQTAAFGSKAERGAVGTATIKGLIGKA